MLKKRNSRGCSDAYVQSPRDIQIVQEVGVIGDSEGRVNHFGSQELGICLLVLVRHVLVDLDDILLIVFVVVQVV